MKFIEETDSNTCRNPTSVHRFTANMATPANALLLFVTIALTAGLGAWKFYAARMFPINVVNERIRVDTKTYLQQAGKS